MNLSHTFNVHSASSSSNNRHSSKRFKRMKNNSPQSVWYRMTYNFQGWKKNQYCCTIAIFAIFNWNLKFIGKRRWSRNKSKDRNSTLKGFLNHFQKNIKRRWMTSRALSSLTINMKPLESRCNKHKKWPSLHLKNTNMTNLKKHILSS